jgi:hypothetical protein
MFHHRLWLIRRRLLLLAAGGESEDAANNREGFHVGSSAVRAPPVGAVKVVERRAPELV